ISMHASHEEIFAPVVVVIANCDTVVESHSCEAGLDRHIFEVTLPVVLEQAVRVTRRGLFLSLDIRAVWEEDIQVAVVVVVEDGDSAGHGLGRMALGGLATVEAEIDGLVTKVNGDWILTGRERPQERRGRGKSAHHATAAHGSLRPGRRMR